MPSDWFKEIMHEEVYHKDGRILEVESLREMQEIIINFQQLKLDAKEASCLKTIALFNPCK